MTFLSVGAERFPEKSNILYHSGGEKSRVFLNFVKYFYFGDLARFLVGFLRDDGR